jgi:hypothetical protein
MRKKIGGLCLAFLVSSCLLAKQVPPEDAGKAGLHFYSGRALQYLSADPSSFQISESIIVRENDLPVYYVFNISDQGYVIVSADDAVTPVLAYSFEGIFHKENQAPQFTAWMQQYARQIRFAQTNHAVPSTAVSEQWSSLLNPGSFPRVPMKNILDVEPLITSNWNQPSPYNEMCPADPGGSNGHAVVGCVPVCMGQIMYYYRWPDHGTGSYTYTDPTYGTQHASFDSTWYRWDNMKNTITSSDSGIAQLLYHLGVSVDLVYGPLSSGMYNHKAAYALKTYFKYSPETRYIYRDSTNLDWDSLIIAHLNRKMPLYYAGWSVPNINGHAFVCDGYQGGDYFHFNFGWAGADNGYFYTNNLTPGGNNFNLAQELILNIYPDTLHYEYPPYCSGSKTLTYNQGSLTDGSGPTQNYKYGNDCSWLIDPQTATDSVSKITLTFDRFDTRPDDSVYIYDGPSKDSPVIANHSGNSIPSPIISTGNKMLVTFQPKNAVTASGWSANYSVTTPVWCNGQKTITADTADITDGSLNFNYHNNSSCRWMVIPASGKKPLTVYFKSFDTEPSKDVLKILDPDSHDTLAIISGHYNSPNLPDSVTSPSGKMFLLFTSNASITSDGFHLYYPKSTLGLLEKARLSAFTVFPNPVHNIVNIEFSSPRASLLTMTLTSLPGKPLLVKSEDCQPGKNQLSLPVDLPSGIYLLRLESETATETFKIIITNY